MTIFGKGTRSTVVANHRISCFPIVQSTPIFMSKTEGKSIFLLLTLYFSTKSCCTVVCCCPLSFSCPSQVALVLQKVEEEKKGRSFFSLVILLLPKLEPYLLWSCCWAPHFFYSPKPESLHVRLFWEWPVRLTSHFILASSYFFSLHLFMRKWAVNRRGRQINIELSSCMQWQAKPQSVDGLPPPLLASP